MSKYSIGVSLFIFVAVTGKWLQLKPTGDLLPCLQEHTAVSYKERIYVFGGEVGFSAGTETPLWVYDIKANSWKKKRTKKGEYVIVFLALSEISTEHKEIPRWK